MNRNIGINKKDAKLNLQVLLSTRTKNQLKSLNKIFQIDLVAKAEPLRIPAGKYFNFYFQRSCTYGNRNYFWGIFSSETQSVLKVMNDF